MSLLIAAVLVLTLLWGEVCAGNSAISLSDRSPMMAATAVAILIPSLAALQLFIGRRRHNRCLPGSWLPRFRMMVVSHTIVWSMASIYLVAFANWSQFARKLTAGTWIPLVDELLLLLPATTGLFVSWIIFVFASPQNTLSTTRKRSEVFWLWFRMKVLLVCVPILFAFFVADFFQIANRIQSATLSGCFWFLGVLVVTMAVAAYPRVLTKIWNTKPLIDSSQTKRVERLLKLSDLRPRRIHVWQTGHRIANAAAVGIIPGSEIIVLSDLLLERFNDEEIDAVVLHEIGHIKKRHCIRRIAMVIGPLVVLAIDRLLQHGLHASLESSDAIVAIFGAASSYLPAIGFAVYLLVLSRWVFRAMEYEADQFAIESSYRLGRRTSIDHALQTMADLFPGLLHQRSGLHPSIAQRLAFAMQVRAGLESQSSANELLIRPSPMDDMDAATEARGSLPKSGLVASPSTTNVL